MNKRSLQPANRRARSPRQYLQSLLSREDLSAIGRLGLWSAFTSEEAARRFAAQPKAERRAFFERYASHMDAEPQGAKRPTRPAHEADYRLFDLPNGASLAQIHSRYRELALSFHPDRADGDTELMQEINEAYLRLQERAR